MSLVREYQFDAAKAHHILLRTIRPSQAVYEQIAQETGYDGANHARAALQAGSPIYTASRTFYMEY